MAINPEIFVSAGLRQSLPVEEMITLISMFRWWKADESREYESPLFGKDSRLVKPTIDGMGYVMSHCHLMPKNDKENLAQWAKAFRRRARKTSDRVLLYVQDGIKFYLIDIADDPGAHEIMRMMDKKGRMFMQKCADEATDFLNERLSLEPA